MKVFWQDRNGSPLPKQGSFFLRGFNSPLRSFPLTVAHLPKPASYKILKKTFYPEKQDWKEMVQKAKSIPKVVLARALVLELDQIPDPFAIAAALLEKAKNSYVFCLSFDSFSFLGASPERLFSRRKREISLDAMAGTKLKGEAFSEKEKKEQSFIPEHIQNTLSSLCTSKISFSPLSIYQTSHLQHLYQEAKGTLKENICDETILEALHPTPALCGTPKEKAYEFIETHEPFNRGFYGGVVGWSNRHAAEFAVAIRSCKIEGSKVTLFSGAGIVEESDPELEWEELNQKLKLYDGILAH